MIFHYITVFFYCQLLFKAKTYFFLHIQNNGFDVNYYCEMLQIKSMYIDL